MRIRVLGDRSAAGLRTAMRCVRDDVDVESTIQTLRALAGAPNSLRRAAQSIPVSREYPTSRARALLMTAAGDAEPPAALTEEERHLHRLWLLPPAEAFALLVAREPRLEAVAVEARQRGPVSDKDATYANGGPDAAHLLWLRTAAEDLLGPRSQSQDPIVRSGLALAMANRHLAGLIGLDVTKYDRPPFVQD